MLVGYLRCLDDLPEQRLHLLFDNNDNQNVPKANLLLSAIYRASQLSAIASRAENKPFVLLGELLGAFVRPYTTPTMSLAEQVASLSKCAHLLFALYRIDGTKLLSGQLYYDMQASIKNFVFCVAKTQLLGGSLPFYLLQTGDDRLESRFGTYRTISSDRNGDLLQMSERAAAAQYIDGVFLANPSWNRAPYRLSLDGRAGVDHTNPRSWLGDVSVDHVNLYNSWLQGRSQAADLLRRAGVSFEFDLAALALESPDIDLMRPFGVYPGVQIDSTEPSDIPVALAELFDTTSDALKDLSSPESDTSAPQPVDVVQPLGDEDLAIEHMLPPAGSDTPPPAAEVEKGWIWVDGKRIHLESAVRYLLGPEGGPKSTDRLRRVCGFTRYLNSANTQSDSILGDSFQLGQLVATFLRIDRNVAVAIMRVTSITDDSGRLVESIGDDDFESAGITMSGQLLQLKLNSGTRYWTQSYESAGEGAGKSASKHSESNGRGRPLVFNF